MMIYWQVAALLMLFGLCSVDGVSPPVCERVRCDPPGCPNPIKAAGGECCDRCIEDCRVILCARPTCSNPTTPPGRCCPVCDLQPAPLDCSRIQCFPPTCPRPKPPSPGQCCPFCLENCAVVSCLVPQCNNPIIPPGLCCPVCPSTPLPPDCLAVLCPVPNCPNPIPPSPGECCARCRQDCRLVRCARPNCENPIIPPGECCGICPLTNDICSLGPDSGPCEAAITRWFYDSSSKQCRTFTYGGCLGNKNNFNDLSTCLSQCALRCPPGVPVAACAVEPCSVAECPAFASAVCVADFCGGCNARFFLNDGREVTDQCSISSDICELPSDKGPCEAAIRRWFYNSASKQCQQFFYGGCQGNDNRFDDLRSCLSRCANNCPPGVSVVRCFANPCSVTRCPSFPNAICVSNFCGGCNARFFINDGTEVTERCTRTSCPAGQIFASCGSTCRPTCEDQRPRTCIGSCLPGCRCPEGTFLNRRVSKCVDSDDCGNCPPGKDPVICLVNPCTQSTCSNFPEAECLFDNCGGCFARFFIGLREVTRQCRITGPRCSVQGQVFQQCRSCPVTCAEPTLFCNLVCRPGCGCPSGQVIDEANNRCVPRDQCPTIVCPIKGQVFQQCRVCPATCGNPNPICTLECRPGCGCPPGQVIDEANNRCVPRDQCSAIVCPVKGQVFQQCRTCPATCSNPDLICTLECRPGCGCPPGQLIDEANNRCVPASQCPSLGNCQIQGQVFQRCQTCPSTCTNFSLPCSRACRPGCGCPPGEVIDEFQNKCVPLAGCSNRRCSIKGQTFQRCKPCPVTCKDVGRPIPCPLVCAPGCGCPSGTVLDEVNQRCVNQENCPPRVDCSAVLCAAVSCPNPIPADPEKGQCCPRCPPGSQCPIRGQIFNSCGSACPPTCLQPNMICIAVCRPGCSCPGGQLIDEKTRSCVPRERCSSADRCLQPVQIGPCRGRFPRYHYSSSARSCLPFVYGGCAGNRNNFRTKKDCQEACQQSRPIDCPPVCSPDTCRRNPHRICTLPPGTPREIPGCGQCDVTVCGACYYSPQTLPLPTLYSRCPKTCPPGNDLLRDGEINVKSDRVRCLRRWGYCVRRLYIANIRRYGRLNNPRDFKCWRPGCALRG